MTFLYLHEKGQGLVEYALILVLIAVVVVVAVTAFGQTVTGLYSQVSSEFAAF